MGLWTASPGALRRVGLGCDWVVAEAAEALGLGAVAGAELARVLGVGGAEGGLVCADSPGGLVGDGSGGERVEADSGGLAELGARVRGVGDGLVLITRDVPGREEASRWERLGAGLAERNLVQSWAVLGSGGAAALRFGAGLRRVLAGGFGCRVWVSARLLEGLVESGHGLAVIASCGWSAHLAMANFVERTPGFRAEGFGRVMRGGAVAVRFEGAGADTAEVVASGGDAS